MDSATLAKDLRQKWGVDIHSKIDIRSLILDKDPNITILWFPIYGNENISGCCSKSDKDKVIFINTNKSIGRQNFTLAHELYHLYYETKDNFVICNQNNKNESEKNADNFAAAFLMPNEALNLFKEKNHIINKWSLNDIIKCEQYFQVSHQAMLYRLLKKKWITQKEFEKFDGNITFNAKKLGYKTQLYNPSNENQQYFSMGKLIDLTEQAFNNKRISQGKRREILLKTYRTDLVYNIER